MARGRPGSRGAPPPRPSRTGGRGKGPDQTRAVRAWAILGGGAIAFLLLLRLASGLLRGGEGTMPAPSGPTGPTATGAAPFASPPPEGTVTATFPRAVFGTRLELKVVGLGDDPSVCVAEGIRVGDDVKSVYHHGCDDAEEIDRAYFLVRVTNTSAGRVPVGVDGFTVVDAAGEEHEALAAPPVGAPATRFFPLELVLGPGASITRWVTIDGSDGDRPERLIYRDGPERLEIRFRGAWV
ncbi:hypothetical protein HRbin12_00065 [bacterium HR12]|nr:hypothetical protein HRbin12_00065 [bacterium HR12]